MESSTNVWIDAAVLTELQDKAAFYDYCMAQADVWNKEAEDRQRKRNLKLVRGGEAE